MYSSDALKKKYHLLIFSFLYALFCYFYFDYFHLFLWIGFSLLFFSFLEDLTFMYFDVRPAIISYIVFTSVNFDLYIILSSLIIFIALFIASKFKVLSDGEPYLITPILLVLPINFWFQYLLLTIVIGILISVCFLVFFKSKKSPFAYAIFLSLIVHTGYYNALIF